MSIANPERALSLVEEFRSLLNQNDACETDYVSDEAAGE